MKYWAFFEKIHLWKIRNILNEVTEKIVFFFAISNGLYFLLL